MRKSQFQKFLEVKEENKRLHEQLAELQRGLDKQRKGSGGQAAGGRMIRGAAALGQRR